MKGKWPCGKASDFSPAKRGFDSGSAPLSVEVCFSFPVCFFSFPFSSLFLRLEKKRERLETKRERKRKEKRKEKKRKRGCLMPLSAVNPPPNQPASPPAPPGEKNRHRCRCRFFPTPLDSGDEQTTHAVRSMFGDAFLTSAQRARDPLRGPRLLVSGKTKI